MSKPLDITVFVGDVPTTYGGKKSLSESQSDDIALSDIVATLKQ